MRKFGFTLILFILSLCTLTVAGCGKSDGSKVPAGGDAEKQKLEGNSKDNKENTEAKKEVSAMIEQFLTAAKQGDDQKIFSLMSPKARQVCGRDKIPSPDPSATMEFKINQINFVSEDGAQVQTTMFDVDAAGNKTEDEFVWVVRKTEEGWRLVGTGFTAFAGMEPIVINFESKEDIEKAEAQAAAQQEVFIAELQKLQKQAAETAAETQAAISNGPQQRAGQPTAGIPAGTPSAGNRSPANVPNIQNQNQQKLGSTSGPVVR